MPTHATPRRAVVATVAAAPAYLVLALGLLLTAWAIVYIAHRLAADERVALDRAAVVTEAAITDRVAHYLDALQGARSLFAASEPVRREDWARYAHTLDLQGRYPGTRSLAYIRWVPAGERAAFLAEMRADGIPEFTVDEQDPTAALAPLTYVEPLGVQARRSLGFNGLAEPSRREALERARDTGQPAATAGTTLAAEFGMDEQRSILLYVPVYRGGVVPTTMFERRAALQGFVLTGWRMDDLMAGLFGPQADALLAFAIVDGSAQAGDRLLYASDGAGATTTIAALTKPTRASTLTVAGRMWTLTYVARPLSGRPDARIVPALVAGGGLAISLLLSLLVRELMRRHRRAERRYRDLIAHTSDIVYEYDLAGRCLALNPAAAHILGYTEAELRALPLDAVIAPEQRYLVHRFLRSLAQPDAVAAPSATAQLAVLTKDGTRRTLEVGTRLIRRRGVAVAVQGIARDITARQAAEVALRASAESFATLLDGTTEGVVIMEQGQIVAINRAYTALLGYEIDEVRGRDGLELVLPADREAAADSIRSDYGLPYEVLQRRKDGSFVATEVTGRPFRYHGRAARLTTVRDITARKASEVYLAHQATHDALTGLPNRALFLDRLEHALARSRRDGRPRAVLFVDLDRFKQVNDTLGHAAGDVLLVAVTARLRSCLRDADTLARFGGDEFAILLEEPDDLAGALRVADRLIAVLASPLPIAGRTLVVTISIGVALSTGPDETPADLLRFADVALYRAKDAGRSCYAAFYPGMDDGALSRLALEHDLRGALDRHELTVHYQPQVDLSTGRVAILEALIRWHHPTRGLIPPGEFIPLAEETGLIRPLGRWVLEEACRQVVAWTVAYPACPAPQLAVNLSAREFRDSELVAGIAATLAATGLRPDRLVLEVTETVAMERVEATIATLAALKSLGVRLALDDFGTGYSSLAYLQRLPLDTLKIDRTFFVESPQNRAIVGAVTTLAHGLGLEVTAEGLETRAQVAWARAAGCNLGQGYYFARPLSSTALAALWATGLTFDGVPTGRLDTMVLAVSLPTEGRL